MRAEGGCRVEIQPVTMLHSRDILYLASTSAHFSMKNCLFVGID